MDSANKFPLFATADKAYIYIIYIYIVYIYIYIYYTDITTYYYIYCYYYIQMSVLDDSREDLDGLDLDLVWEKPLVGDGQSLHSIPEILVSSLDDELVKCLLLVTTFYDNICSATKETKKCRSNLTLQKFFFITLSLFYIAVATWMLCRADVSVNIDCLIASIVFSSITLISSLVSIYHPSESADFFVFSQGINISIGFSLIRLACSFNLDGPYFNDIIVFNLIEIPWFLYLSMHAFANDGTIRDFLSAAGLLLNLCDLYRSLPVVISNRALQSSLQCIIFFATVFSAPSFNASLDPWLPKSLLVLHKAIVLVDYTNVLSLLACTIYRVTAFKGLFEDNSSTNSIFIVIAFVQLFVLDGYVDGLSINFYKKTLFTNYTKKRMYSVLSFDRSDENCTIHLSRALDNSNDEAAVVLYHFKTKCDFDSSGDLDFFEFVAFINLLKLKGANTDNLPKAWDAYNNVYMATQLFDIYQYIRRVETEKTNDPLLFFCTLGANTDEIRSKLVEIGIIGS